MRKHSLGSQCPLKNRFIKCVKNIKRGGALFRFRWMGTDHFECCFSQGGKPFSLFLGTITTISRNSRGEGDKCFPFNFRESQKNGKKMYQRQPNYGLEAEFFSLKTNPKTSKFTSVPNAFNQSGI